MNFAGQNAAAEAQIRQQQEYARQRNQALRLQQESIRAQQAQNNEKEAAERFKVTREARRAKSTAQTAASAGGVAGASIDSLIRDFSVQTSFFTEASKKQEQYNDAQADLQTRASTQQAQFDVFSNNPPVEKPSFAAAALRIGSQLIGGLK